MQRALPGALALVGLLVGTVLGQDWARARLEKSPRHGEWVTVKQGTRAIKAFCVYPEVKGKVPTVLVIHEIFGLTDWVRLLADELAEAGYIALAPDLLSGQGPKGEGTEGLGSGDEVRKAIFRLPPEQILADLDACVAWLAQLPAGNGKVAVCGFCWGGGQAFRFATHNRTLRAAFVFYGPPPSDPAALARIACPVYGFYGGNDNRINATIPKTREQMKAAGKIYEPVIYEGAGHGFMRAGEAPEARPANQQARDAAWQRWKTLLKQL
jgi:carboxymethylenebutenolidase